MTNELIRLAEQLRDDVRSNSGLRDDYQEWSDILAGFDKLIDGLRNGHEPTAPQELPEHVHSWDGDQCHYCHIPRKCSHGIGWYECSICLHPIPSAQRT